MSDEEIREAIDKIISQCSEWDEWGDLEFDRDKAIEKILELIKAIKNPQ